MSAPQDNIGVPHRRRSFLAMRNFMVRRRSGASTSNESNERTSSEFTQSTALSPVDEVKIPSLYDLTYAHVADVLSHPKAKKVHDRPETFGHVQTELTETLLTPVFHESIRITKFIAAGGTAFVLAGKKLNNPLWATRAHIPTHKFAIKLTTRKNKSVAEATKAEIKILQRIKDMNLDSTHLNFMFEAYSLHHYLIILMPLMKIDLFHLLLPKRSPLVINGQQVYVTEQSLRSIFTGIVRGLHVLHENGIAHGDLKVENILIDITRNDQPSSSSSEPWICHPHISDFGHAKYADPFEHPNGPEYWFYGTYDSTPPEFWSAFRKDPGSKAPALLVRTNVFHSLFPADMWALGCILQGMYSGLRKAYWADAGYRHKLYPTCIGLGHLDNWPEIYDPRRDSIAEKSEELVECLRNLLRTSPTNRPTTRDVLGMNFLQW